jgi:spermidine/putrescine transport system substrate-binding protein
VGNIWVAHGYSNDIFQANLDAQAAKRGFNIVHLLPKEGASLSLDAMVVPKTAPRPDLAFQFINFMLDGKNSADLTNLIGSGNPNNDAMQYIKAEIKANKAVFPDAEAAKKLEMLRDLNAKELRTLSKLWTEVKLK